MARMPDIEREAAEAAGWFRTFEQRVMHDLHQHASQAPAATPVTVRTTTTTEDHMSLAADLHALAARLEPLGEETVSKLEAVLSHPETAPLLGTLSQLAGVGLPVGLISEVAGGLTGLAKAYAPSQQAAA